MSKMIELKAYHLSELGKEVAGYSTEISHLLGKVDKFKELDLTGIQDSLTESLSQKLLVELDVAFGLMDASHAENLDFLKRLIDLKPILAHVEMELMGKIEEKLLEKLDEMINKVNNDKIKPSLPSRSNTGVSAEGVKAATSNIGVSEEHSKSNTISVESKKESSEKGTPSQKKGAFSKMLTHLTKARPKANRTKRSDATQASEDSLGGNRDESQSLETYEVVDQTRFSKDQEDLNHVEVPPSAISTLASVLNQGNNDTDKVLLESLVKSTSPANAFSPKEHGDESPAKPSRPKMDESEGVVPATAPRPAKKPAKAADDNNVQPETVEVSPSKPKLAPRPPKSINNEVSEVPGELENIPYESIPYGAMSRADDVISDDISTRRVSPVAKNTPESPKSDMVISSIDSSQDQAKRPISVADGDGQHQDNNPVAPSKRVPGLSGQHGAIGALAAAVTGRKIPAGEASNATGLEPPLEVTTEVKITPKPTPPKRPVKNMANDSKNPIQTETAAPVPKPRIGSSEKIHTDRPQSEMITHMENMSPVEVKRPISMIEDIHSREGDHPLDSELQVQIPAPPKRIPGVFATQHGAIGALAAAVTGRRNNSVSSHSDDGSPTIASRNNTISSAVASPTEVKSFYEENENAQDTTPYAADDGPDKPRAHIPPVKSNSFISNTPMTFKKKDASLSGDDKGIEKSALDWLNQHLAAKDIHIDSLYDSLKDGLNLIYAIEDAMKESVGKYNKRTMLPVHKIDNLAVALSFLAKKGVDVQFITPQDIMDGNKGKILTLFVGILKL